METEIVYLFVVVTSQLVRKCNLQDVHHGTSDGTDDGDCINIFKIQYGVLEMVLIVIAIITDILYSHTCKTQL